jgi:hypothetical protein
MILTWTRKSNCPKEGLSITDLELYHEMDLALRRLQGLSSEGASRGDMGRRNAAEKRYHDAYMALVRAGLRRPLRGKYRG